MIALINWITSWAEGIIIAVIVGTIIEMIIPNGNSKKYIKIIVGIYILNAIISPIILKFTGQSIEVNSSEVESFFKTSSNYQSVTNTLEDTNNSSIVRIYRNKLEEDIKSKIKEKGYEVTKLTVDLELQNKYEKQYGKIKKIQVGVMKSENDNINQENSILINEIQININDNNTKQQLNSKGITEAQKKELIEYISDSYEISEESIEVIE